METKAKPLIYVQTVLKVGKKEFPVVTWKIPSSLIPTIESRTSFKNQELLSISLLFVTQNKQIATWF